MSVWWNTVWLFKMIVEVYFPSCYHYKDKICSKWKLKTSQKRYIEVKVPVTVDVYFSSFFPWYSHTHSNTCTSIHPAIILQLAFLLQPYSVDIFLDFIFFLLYLFLLNDCLLFFWDTVIYFVLSAKVSIWVVGEHSLMREVVPNLLVNWKSWLQGSKYIIIPFLLEKIK